jgi:hypothetical protein
MTAAQLNSPALDGDGQAGDNDHCMFCRCGSDPEQCLRGGVQQPGLQEQIRTGVPRDAQFREYQVLNLLCRGIIYDINNLFGIEYAVGHPQLGEAAATSRESVILHAFHLSFTCPLVEVHYLNIVPIKWHW